MPPPSSADRTGFSALASATEALEAGAEAVVVADANAENPVRSALDGGGTYVLPGALGGEE